MYGSLTPETALQESPGWFRDYGIPDPQTMPRVMVAIEGKLQHILDLTDARIRRRLGVTREQLCDRTWRESNERNEHALVPVVGSRRLKLRL